MLECRVRMTGGSPWGFRLYGGDFQPLMVAKIRQRSSSHEAGLKEEDVILGINDYACQGMEHSTAMSLVESSIDLLTFDILRNASAEEISHAISEYKRTHTGCVASALSYHTSSHVRQQSSGSQGHAPAYVSGYNSSDACIGPRHTRRNSQCTTRVETVRTGDTTKKIFTETQVEDHGQKTFTKITRETTTTSRRPSQSSSRRNSYTSVRPEVNNHSVTSSSPLVFASATLPRPQRSRERTPSHQRQFSNPLMSLSSADFGGVTFREDSVKENRNQYTGDCSNDRFGTASVTTPISQATPTSQATPNNQATPVQRQHLQNQQNKPYVSISHQPTNIQSYPKPYTVKNNSNIAKHNNFNIVQQNKPTIEKQTTQYEQKIQVPSKYNVTPDVYKPVAPKPFSMQTTRNDTTDFVPEHGQHHAAKPVVNHTNEPMQYRNNVRNMAELQRQQKQPEPMQYKNRQTQHHAYKSKDVGYVAPGSQNIYQPAKKAGIPSPLRMPSTNSLFTSGVLENSMHSLGGELFTSQSYPDGECLSPLSNFIGREKKMFSDSSFYDDPNKKYPTIEEQIKMARRVALSLMSPANVAARGHEMFIKRRQKAPKWTTDEFGRALVFDVSEDEETGMQISASKYFRPDAWQTRGHTWQPGNHCDNTAVRHLSINAETTPHHQYFSSPVAPPPPPPPPPPATSLTVRDHTNLRTNTMFSHSDKSGHQGVSPAICFSLADGLRNSQGKAGEMFAKRRARVDKYVLADNRITDTPTSVKNAQPTAITQIGQRIQAEHSLSTTVGVTSSPTPRLQQMIEIDKARISPWDAAVASNGACIDEAFAHIDDYERRRNLANMGVPESLVKRELAPSTRVGPIEVQGRMPDGVRKIKGWGASGEVVSQPASQGHDTRGNVTQGHLSHVRSTVSTNQRQSHNFQPVTFKVQKFKQNSAPYGFQQEVGVCDL